MSDDKGPPTGRAPRRLTVRRVRAFVRRHVIGVQTPSGKVMDLLFIGAVFVGIIALALESVPSYAERYGHLLIATEIVVGSMFIVEYAARIWVAAKRWRYVFSFWGLIDLLAILPFLFQGFGFAYLRLFRVLRIFAILKVTHYTQASSVLMESLGQSQSKIMVFLLTVCVLVSVIGFTMHAVEPETFPTVPDAIWWTVVTITTVGYGDSVPHTVLGKLIAAVSMIAAFGIIAVPTGIVAVEYGNALQNTGERRPCDRCARGFHETSANYCATCGERLPKPDAE